MKRDEEGNGQLSHMVFHEFKHVNDKRYVTDYTERKGSRKTEEQGV